MSINQQFENLAQAMRVQLEQINKYTGLVEVDEAEAKSNVDLAVKSVLDSFHNVSDAVQNLTNKSKLVDFYQYPELHLILLIRNARHHNNQLRSIFNENRKVMLVDFDFETDSFGSLIYPMNWEDIIAKIQESQKSRDKYQDIRSFISADDFEVQVQQSGYTINSIYVNLIALILQAGRKLVEICRPYIMNNQLTSFESKFFLKHFENFPNKIKPSIKYDYDIESYKHDIEKIFFVTEKLSETLFDGEPNVYLQEIKYKSLK